MKRTFDPQEPEFMDLPDAPRAELEVEMRNLAAINRQFGSHRLLRKFLDLWLTPGRTYRVLDLCTGGGDLPRVMVDWARVHDVTLRIDAVDASGTAIEIARAASLDYPEINFIRDDALKYETKETYDFVNCALALHHFENDHAVQVLSRCRDLSHRFVLVSDLERGPLTLCGVYLLTTLWYREPATRQDGLSSARRAFSYGEFRTLAETARWREFGHGRFIFCRQALWLDLRRPGDIPIIEPAVAEVLPCPT